jgi:RNA polymerase sigma factor (TIGR02999 family)
VAGPGDITLLLQKWSGGDPRALDQLMPIVYNELRILAASSLRSESTSATLQSTALVHEVYLRLVGQNRVEFHSRKHFYGAVAQIIRRILVDRARERKAAKRGGGAEKIALEDAFAVPLPGEVDVSDLDQALSVLDGFDPGKARLVELRYFAGLSIPETAEVLGVSPTTVKREWAIARAWLFDRLRKDQSAPSES